MKKFQQSVFFLAVVALACHMRAADTSATWQYAGTVVDDQGRAVAGANVDCYQFQSSRGWFGYMPWDPQISQHTTTDSKGGFAFSSSPGATLVVVRKAGLAPAWKIWTSTLADSSDPLVLTAPTTLAGVVMDENDQPVAGVEVWVSDAIVGDVYSVSQFNNLSGQSARDCFSARTGADGRFRIENFPTDGHASLAVSKPGKAQHRIGNTSMEARDFRSGQTNIELLLGPAGTVEGKVAVQGTGQPLAGAKVWLQSRNGGGDWREPIQSGVDGTFRILDVRSDSYNVTATFAGQPVTEWVMMPENGSFIVLAGQTTSNVLIQVSKGALVEVTVVVTNELTPLANAVVSSGRSTAYTGANGVALLRVPTGKNWFSARKDWRSQNSTVEIEAGQTNHVRIELIPPPRITGTVRDLSGAPAAGVRVSFHPGQYPGAPDYAEVMTDNNGRYEMILKLSRENPFWDGPISPTNFVLARSLEQNLAAIQEFDAIPTNLDLNLQLGITLSGSVKDTEGVPVTNAMVNLSILSGHSLPKFEPRLTKVDAQGSFLFPALPQGRQYYLFGGITAKGYGSGGGVLKEGDSKTNHYEFSVFVLKRADRILAGQVLGPDGNPFAGATVNFSGRDQRQWPSTKSDRHGNFVFDAVCEGEVQLHAYAYDGGPPGQGVYITSGSGAGIKTQAGDTNIVINLRDSSGNRKPLHEAARNGDKNAVELLLANKAEVNAKDIDGVTPLHEAVKRGNKAVVELLLTNKADINARDIHGVTPLHETAVGSSKDVAESLRVDMAELLLVNNAEVNVRANNGFTPLHWAALYGHRELAEVLLANGAEVNAMNNNGQTPLHWAIANRNENVTELLRQHGGLENGYEAGRSVGATTNWDAAAMRGAIQSGDSKAVEALLKENPALIFSKDDQSRTPLILAAFQGKKDVAALLLASKSDIKVRDIFGRMALHWAAQRGFKDVVELLLANNAEIEARDNSGNTPLFLAADLGRKEVAELLIANNADVNATNNVGWTPFHSLMMQQQKDPPAGTGTPTQAIHAAILQRQKGVVEVLRQHGGHE